MENRYLFFYTFGNGREYRYISSITENEAKQFDELIITNGVFIIAKADLESIEENGINNTVFKTIHSGHLLKCDKFPTFIEI